ncbi:NAD(P)H-hydrate epimerase [Aeromicrobium sp. UC242_57]|uniref:NAD(P)H-hydrate epimerase n=1 Tax=Aeromicrobium sp. UC242_57 TaxID=3374624 RepID=UPI003788B05E
MSWQDIEVVNDASGAPGAAPERGGARSGQRSRHHLDAPVDLARHDGRDGLRGGRMLRAHQVADIRAAEEALAATLPAGEPMRRAARGLADGLDHVAAGEVVLMLIGPGNNGGDALWAAVHLRDRGVRVDLCLLDPEKVHAGGLAAAVAAGARVVEAPSDQRHCLDAMFGIGARPGLVGKAAEWAEWIAGARPYTIAVDVPSGVDVDHGTRPDTCVVADATITFGTYKNALLVNPAAGAAGWNGTALAQPSTSAWQSTCQRPRSRRSRPTTDTCCSRRSTGCETLRATSTPAGSSASRQAPRSTQAPRTCASPVR